MKLMREDNKKTERSALRRAAAPVAVALILLLAGCAGAGGGAMHLPIPRMSQTKIRDQHIETTENTTEEDNLEQVEGDFADKFSTEDEELREEIDGYDLTMAHERPRGYLQVVHS